MNTLENYIQQARFLIIDDEMANVALLQQNLERRGYTNIFSTTDSRQAVGLFEEVKPDIVLLDLMMPHIDGLQVLEQLKPLLPQESHVPIVVLTADITPAAKRNALTAGARDFLTKPFDPTELLLRIWNLLETRYLQLQLQDQNLNLELKVQERTRSLEAAQEEAHASQIEVIERLAQAAEFRDDDTGQHTQRVASTASLIARRLGMEDSRVELLRRAAPLHDVGKIGIPDAILLKPGKLTAEEFQAMKGHTLIGARLLDQGRSEFVQTAALIALTHHERWDGSGYPQGTSGEDIPIEGRIVAIADVFDALTNERPYKKAWPVEDAIAEITNQKGRHFDPNLVEIFSTISREELLSGSAAELPPNGFAPA